MTLLWLVLGIFFLVIFWKLLSATTLADGIESPAGAGRISVAIVALMLAGHFLATAVSWFLGGSYEFLRGVVLIVGTVLLIHRFVVEIYRLRPPDPAELDD